MTVTDHIQRCPGTTICAKGMGSFIALLWSLRPFCLTHADTLWWDRMHYGETECLKQRCVHQQVSDSSGWAKNYHRFNWGEVTIDVPWLMARPWFTITSIENYTTWGGAWTRIPYIVCACVDDGVAKSHFHVNRKKKEMMWLETSMYKDVMRAVCFGPPNQGGLPSPQKEV